ncbi:1,2-phenylacetyl-CoA epoxidase subunit PaaD [Streptomyces alboflavus]|uniref:1,2-phenylacetyl-CoA epoxidase subunit PaaD n=1 Tax=Streptomyces alboflavus TaxID=67267 RepID=UPI00369C7CE2
MVTKAPQAPTATHTASVGRSVPTAPTAPAESATAPAPTALEARLHALAGSVPDPELPVLSLAELGVLRSVRVGASGHVDVELTPTYTGCPAIEAMSADIEQVLREDGQDDVTVRTVLSPAWSTDDISAEGRRKLAEFGIAPPRPHAAEGPIPLTLTVRCPHCGSTDTELLSRFSSTACKALRRCVTCREPFDHFKEL